LTAKTSTRHLGIMNCAVAMLAFVLPLVTLQQASAAPPTPERQSELVRMVRQDCGSCHGLRLAGGLGPALLPAALADQPVDALVATVLNGRPGSAMPGWSRFMDENEAQWIVRELLKGFPEQ